MYFDRKDDINFIKWARAVKVRDQFICDICGRRGVELNAHHKNSWDWAIDERFDMDNGVTLCYNCHHSFHDIYGYGGNNEQQYQEFKRVCDLLTFDIKKNVVLRVKKSSWSR